MEFEMDGESESDSMNDIAKVLKAAKIPLTFGIDPEADPEEGPVEQNIIIKNPTNGKPIYISSEWYNTADEPEYMIGGPGVYGTMLEPYDDTVTKLEVIDLIKDLYKRDEVTESMKSTSKTTKKRLTAQIKEMILAEMDSSEFGDKSDHEQEEYRKAGALEEADPGIKKVEDAIKSGKIKPEEVKSAAEKAMKGDPTALAMMMAGIGPMFEMVEESEYDTMSDSELIELANDEGMEEMIVRDGEDGLANRQEIIDALKGPMSEAKKKSKKDEEAPEEMDAEIDAEVDAEMPIDAPEPSHTDVQKELTDALEAAKASGDEKLVRQIGNALTYFTRSQVAGEEGNMSGLNESFIKKMQRTAGIIK